MGFFLPREIPSCSQLFMDCDTEFSKGKCSRADEEQHLRLFWPVI